MNPELVDRAADFYCLVAEQLSVESRFGLRDCRPRGVVSHCELHLGDWALRPDGRIQLGALAVAADHIVGEVPFVHRLPDQWSLTTELTIEFVAPVLPAAELHLWGAPGRMERTGGYAYGGMQGASGRDAVRCSTRTLLVQSTAVAPLDTDMVRAWGATPLGASSIDEHLSLECSFESDTCQVTLPTPAGWQNQFGILHGGVWACLAEVASARAVERVRPQLETATVHVVYLRPGPASGPVKLTARVRYAGSRLALTDCVGTAADGTECVVATVTSRSVTEPLEKEGI